MLNYETILSSYDDKMTLMQWLKKVEEALKDASATAFEVTRLDNERVKFSLTFANGEKLETSVLIAIKGEKGDTGTSVVRFYISGGHLYVELDNGVTQDLGLLFSGDINVGGTITCTGVNAVNVFATGEVEGHKVTGDEIVEKMSGYSFLPNNDNVANGIVLTYASAVKNGNKLTLVVAGEITPNANMAPNPTIGYFVIPNDVKSKIVANSLGYFDNRVVSFYSSGSQLPIDRSIIMFNSFNIQMFQVKTALTIDTTYSFRYEVTFLLSDNMVGN